MIDPPLLKGFLNHTVTVFLKNNFRYRGVLSYIGETHLRLEDHLEGPVILSLSEIDTIRGVR